MNNRDEVVRERVVRFTSEQLGCGESELTDNTRLLQDLGMDGDDAVEFFERFGDTFKIDLQDLYRNWNQHFGGEGVPVGGMSAFCVVAFACFVAGLVLREKVGGLPSWAWAGLLISVVFFVYAKWFQPANDMLPVTIGDLLESVRLGRWNQTYASGSVP